MSSSNSSIIAALRDIIYSGKDMFNNGKAVLLSDVFSHATTVTPSQLSLYNVQRSCCADAIVLAVCGYGLKIVFVGNHRVLFPELTIEISFISIILLGLSHLQSTAAHDRKGLVRRGHREAQPPLFPSTPSNETNNELICTPFGACEPCPPEAVHFELLRCWSCANVLAFFS